MLTLTQIRFCAMECKRQQSGEESVANMCDAFFWAISCVTLELPLTNAFIRRLGYKVEPQKNATGYRSQPVYFDNDRTKQALDASKIDQALNSLINHGDLLHSNDKYHEFEMIHPFNDGNGRVGAILYNTFWAGGNKGWDNPIVPPDLFGSKPN